MSARRNVAVSLYVTDCFVISRSLHAILATFVFLNNIISRRQMGIISLEFLATHVIIDEAIYETDFFMILITTIFLYNAGACRPIDFRVAFSLGLV